MTILSQMFPMSFNSPPGIFWYDFVWQQYALKEKDEKVGSDTKGVEVKEVETPEEQPSVPAAEPDATASAFEESSASEPAPAPAVTEETTETAAPEESSDNTETSAASEQEEEKEEEPAPKEVPEIKFESAPADPRFPTTNQTRHCFTRYVEYHRCVAAKGEGAPECDKFQKYYRALCPSEWVERWNEQRENGTFPGPL